MMKNNNIKHLTHLFERYPNLIINEKDIVNSYKLLIKCFSNGNKLLVCGNGGSAADSEHIVGELMKGFILPRKINQDLRLKINNDYVSDALQIGLPAIALVSHTALSTAFSNDQAPDIVFAQQVLGYGKKGDILLAISTSGNSSNCVYAAQVAKAFDMNIISLTGKNESKLSAISDITIKVPETETYKIQEFHLPIYHALCLAIEEYFFGNK